ncbi:MAG: LamG-like jellyroll fold domain-containing protein, partial [Verrucomicrobiota bacterium]
VSATGQARILIRNDANVIILDRLSTRTVFEIGGATWHHIVWTDSAGKGKLYVDGVVDETDFTYTPSALTMNVTAVGSFARTTASAIIFGDVDEVAVWNRALSYSDIQVLKNSSVPMPLAPTPPSITTEPVSANVFTGATVTFSVVVAGTGPFSYQWVHDSVPVSTGTNLSLVLTNVQLMNAGLYSVSVTGPGGSTNSTNATLSVTTRPAPPSSLSLDFNNRGALPGETEPGFESFTLDGTGATTLQTTRLFGGVEVTVGGSNGTTADSRLRAAPVNSGAFTEALLLQDFIFSPPTTGAEGLDVTVKFLAPNQLYTGTVWGYDQGNAGARVTDWFANGVLVKDNYTFDGSVAPTDNLQYQFSFPVTSDAQGTVVIQGRREVTGTGVSVFLNALRIAIPVTRVSKVELIGGNVRLTVETPDSSKAHSVEKTDTLSPISFGPVAGVMSTILSPTSVQLEFAQPANGMQFYRVTRTP